MIAIYRTNVSGFAYTHDIVLCSNNYTLATVNSYAFAACMRIYASKTKVLQALILCEQRQTVLLVGELLKGVEKFKYFGSKFSATARAPTKIRGRVNVLVPYAFLSLGSA